MRGMDLDYLVLLWLAVAVLSGLLRRRGTPPPQRGGRSPRTPWAGQGRWQRPGGSSWRPLPPGPGTTGGPYEGLQRDRRPSDAAQVTSAARPVARPAARPASGRGPEGRSTEPAEQVLEPSVVPSVEYLGSMGFASSEGATLEGPALEFEPGGTAAAVLPYAAGAVRASPAVGRALSLLQPAEGEGRAAGAAAAIVLSEILGPPRALRPYRNPVAARRRERPG